MTTISFTFTNKYYEDNKERHLEKSREIFSKLDDELRVEMYTLMDWMRINGVESLTLNAKE